MTLSMRAIVQERYGTPEDCLHLREIERPTLGGSEVLVRVRAASVHADVWHVVSGRPYVIRPLFTGLRKPRHPVPGTDLAGVVEVVGRDVTRFKPGDEVFGESHGGLQWQNGGAFAEYAAVPQEAIALKPACVSFEQAATVPTAGIIVLQNLHAGGRIQPGWNVLVNGAGGGVGAIALQLAKAYGARVTGVDRTDKLDLLRTLGADEVVDYTREDVTRRGERYDLIFDVASTLDFTACKRILTPAGSYVLIGHDHYGNVGNRTFGSLPRFFAHMARSPFERHLPLTFSLPSKHACMAELKEFLATGALTPVVERAFPLEAVPEALRFLTSGQARGRLVITP